MREIIRLYGKKKSGWNYGNQLITMRKGIGIITGLIDDTLCCSLQ